VQIAKALNHGDEPHGTVTVSHRALEPAEILPRRSRRHRRSARAGALPPTAATCASVGPGVARQGERPDLRPRGGPPPDGGEIEEYPDGFHVGGGRRSVEAKWMRRTTTVSRWRSPWRRSAPRSHDHSRCGRRGRLVSSVFSVLESRAREHRQAVPGRFMAPARARSPSCSGGASAGGGGYRRAHRAREGRRVSAIFAQYGEPYFRSSNAPCCRSCSHPSAVIATGGARSSSPTTGR
jgi:hypothetical protein